MYFLTGDHKLLRNFYFRSNFGHLKNFRFSHFRLFFQKFDFGRDWRAEIFGVLSEIFFRSKNIYFLGGNQTSAKNFYFLPKLGEIWLFKKN